jgi:hypothetical protein
MKFHFAIVLSTALLALGGCATKPQEPVVFAPTKITDPAIRIGVAMGPLPKVDTYFPGADCLLCMAAASVANSSLTSHTQKLPSTDLANVKNEIADLLKKKGVKVKVIADALIVSDLPSFKTDAPNFARKDFTSLKAKYDVDKLIVITIGTLGMWRPYSAYFPTSAPKAAVTGTGVMVNLADNSYDWFEPIGIYRTADGVWDEAPNFPGLTNAYYQAVEQAKDNLKKPFAP